MSVAVVIIYSHPELYPPTLNTVQSLSGHFSKIYLICNNVVVSDWDYPANVEIVCIGSYLPIRQFEQQPVLQKIKLFWKYFNTVYRYTRGVNLVLTYDTIPLLIYGLSLRYFQKNAPIWWYHNHDIVDFSQLRKGSIGWLAAKLEPSLFRWTNIFSLPATERKSYFPLSKYQGKYFFLPNYPALCVYANVQKPSLPTEELKLIYQGSISEGHGLEEVITLLGQYQNYLLTLTLIGRIDENYKKRLESQAKKVKTHNWLTYLPAVSYKELPAITRQHHIGLAIHEPKGKIYATGGTASNKIYEYAACGLPILYLNIPHYLEYLSQFVWAKKVNLNTDSILKAINSIYIDYYNLSNSAKSDFISVNNFEKQVEEVVLALKINT